MNKSEPNNYSTEAMQISNLKHGGNVYENAKKLNLLPSEIIDASASLVPFDPPQILLDSLNKEIKNLGFRYYPERNLSDLKEIIGKFHGINPDNILPGNGASELIILQLLFFRHQAPLLVLDCFSLFEIKLL